MLSVKLMSIFWLVGVFMLQRVDMQTNFMVDTMEVRMQKDSIGIAIKDMPGIENVKYRIVRNCPLKNVVDINSLPEEYSYGISAPENGLWRVEIGAKWNDYDLICLNADIRHRGRQYQQRTPPVRIAELRQGTICEPTQTTTAFGKQDYCTNALIFEDEFAVLNNSHWRMDVRIALYQLHEEFVVFDDSMKNSFVKDNQLYILPTIVDGNLKTGRLNLGTKCTAQDITECELSVDAAYKVLPPIQSALLNTRNSFHFQYGRVEVRAKLPKGDWLFPYLSLQSVSNYQRAEIRIAFARGNELLKDAQNHDISGKLLYGGTIYWDKKKMAHYNMRELHRDYHFGDDFHIFSLTWKANMLSLTVDGEMFGEINDNMEIFQQPFYLSFGVSAGGHVEFKDVAEKPWSDTNAWAALHFYRNCDVWRKTWKNGKEALIVDYVRVYAI